MRPRRLVVDSFGHGSTPISRAAASSLARSILMRAFVILSFAARWLAGEVKLNEELDDARWLAPHDLAGLTTTEGLAEIIAAARALLGA